MKKKMLYSALGQKKNGRIWEATRQSQDNDDAGRRKTFLHIFEFKCENKFYANTCKVEK